MHATTERDAGVRSDAAKVWYFLLAWLGLSLAAVAVPSGCAHDWCKVFYALFIALASVGVGVLMGFLFGIPRTLQETSAPAPAVRGAASTESPPVRLGANTNIEQISDWLTKILVGVGLTQLRDAPHFLTQVGDRVGPVLGAASTVGAAFVVNFFVAGFFVGYLGGRLILPGAFREADGHDLQLKGQAQAAKVLSDQKDFEGAIPVLLDTYHKLSPDSPSDVRKQVFEGLSYNYLYQPNGYKDAIAFGEEYVREEPKGSAIVWANLASAYGQQYAEELRGGKTADQIRPTRDKALNAVERALALEPKLKGLLHMLWDPADPTKVSVQENDLEVFFNDPDFKKLLEA